MDNPIKVLCIDDEYMIRRTVKTYLENFNYKVYEAEDGESGIDKFREIDPDIVFCDITMPVIGGMDVLKVIHRESPNTPVIMMSGNGLMSGVIDAMRLGAWNYIEKPVQDLKILNISIENALEKVRLIQENIEYEKNLEKMLETRTRQLIKTERMAAVSSIIQGIVHNMRSPLNVILNIKKLFNLTLENINSDLKNEYGELSPKLMSEIKSLGDIISINHKASERLNDMVNSLMVKSRNDKLEDVVLINLNELVQNEIDFLLKTSYQKSRIKLNIELSEEVLMVKVVRAEVNQIFGNLVKNSLDALYKQDYKELEIGTGRNDKECWLYVKDNGPGIPDEIKDKLFDPFFTTKPTETKDSDNEPIGTGLGLHFCRETAKSYGGNVILESEIGKGTKVTIILPLYMTETDS
ncbi:MAG: hybrid sensor histidine kinase/response regulator [Candidatus Cloacimonetes bacterium]|nr:hybrid sensor histidine kinase/response regulator [Candidatus Cloacimonadota bacterium]